MVLILLVPIGYDVRDYIVRALADGCFEVLEGSVEIIDEHGQLWERFFEIVLPEAVRPLVEVGRGVLVYTTANANHCSLFCH